MWVACAHTTLPPRARPQIWVACVGDSRCVKGTRIAGDSREWRCTELSTDQRPDAPAEKARIEGCGGFVSPSSREYGPARVWRGGIGVGAGMAMARSIGDHAMADLGVISTPEIVEAPIGDDDEVIILASDGVWEFISSEEALAVVHRHRDNATIACEALIAEATEKWRQVSHSATSTGGHRLTSVASST